MRPVAGYAYNHGWTLTDRGDKTGASSDG
jgi:hypothetical protein